MKNKKKKSQTNKNGFIRIIEVIIVVALLTLLIVYAVNRYNSSESKIHKTNNTEKSVSKNNKPTQAKSSKTQKKSTQQTAGTTSENTYINKMNGDMLTLENNVYTIDYASVDAPKPMTGKYKINGDTLIFFEDKNRCHEIEGKYLFTRNNDNLSISIISDDCTKRKSSLVGDWDKIIL